MGQVCNCRPASAATGVDLTAAVAGLQGGDGGFFVDLPPPPRVAQAPPRRTNRSKRTESIARMGGQALRS